MLVTRAARPNFKYSDAVKSWGGAFSLALGCLLVAAVAGAESAGAKPRFAVHERSLSLYVEIEASNGYRGWIATEGHRQVSLALAKGETLVEARTTGRVTRHGIEARFGGMGRVSVRFRGKPFSLGLRDGDGERRCRGRRSRFEDGIFSGTIRFRGENGFTEVNAKRAGGFLVRHYRRICRKDRPKARPGLAFKRLIDGLPVTALRTRAQVAGANVAFDAAAIDFRPILGPSIGLSYVFSAQTVERIDGMRLTRRVTREGGPGSFLYPRGRRAPRTATVTPPKPFASTAKYLEQTGSPSSWTGPLASRLPGAGLVALAGPGFKADTCNLTFKAFVAGGCLPKSDRVPLRPLRQPHLPQLSGSQSQAFWDARLSWSR